MLRPKKLRPLEMRILWVIALVLVVAGIVGILLAIYRADWRILCASAGIGGLAALYVSAARRGKPL
jgi:hypothetical protein